jgi:hypothetical protein
MRHFPYRQHRDHFVLTCHILSLLPLKYSMFILFKKKFTLNPPKGLGATLK